MNYLTTVIVSALAGVFFAMMGWPIEALLICIAVVIVVNVVYVIYTAAFSTNLAQLQRYIDKNKRNEIYYYAHILPTASDNELMEALQSIVKKYKHTKYKSIYGAYLALMLENADLAREYNTPIKHSEVGRYTEALIDVSEGFFDKAMNADVKKPWMQHSIAAHIAFFKKDVTAFTEQSQLAIDTTRGVQHFVSVHTFARMERELKNRP